MEVPTYVISTVGLSIVFLAGLVVTPLRAILVSTGIAALFYVAIATFLGYSAAQCWNCVEDFSMTSNSRSDFFVAWLILYGPFSTFLILFPLAVAAGAPA